MKLIVIENLGKIDKKPPFNFGFHYEIQKVNFENCDNEPFYRRQKIDSDAAYRKVTSCSYAHAVDSKRWESGLWKFRT